ncbi:ATP-dependent DNA helicase [hydrothermal vent metagenome]|uniref:ATP-dependent DNA helicase n=1 Tax=hydrothermal vent metagenome TaxID=652676 RepID=A0A1W1DUR3_9ZZZZ|nr:hypothetical protein [Gammaproteobacteria bacterium]
MDWFSGGDNKNKNTHKSESIEDNIKDFKENSVNQTKAKQRGFYFAENPDKESNKKVLGSKLGLSYNFENLAKRHIEILKKCKPENTAAELMKISKRSNKSKFKNDILNPLIESGFLQRTLPDKPNSPKQKYRLTGKFVAKILKN